MLKVRDHDPGSVLDYGCGYGALLDELRRRATVSVYQGYDVAEEMIAAARGRHPDGDFTSERGEVRIADHVIASGIFNVKEGAAEDNWREHVLTCLDDIASLARGGFAFNVLTKYSDPERMRDDLFYADPCFYFDLCKRRYSRHVALLHDYGLYEFTLLVRKEG